MNQVKTAVAGVLAAASIGVMGMAQTSAPATRAPAQKSWADYVTVKGDVRLRYETINDDAKVNSAGDTYTRDRARIRARLGAESKVDDLKVGIRFSTGGADPISGNQTLGDGFAKKEIRMDLAYLDYAVFLDRPYELHLIGGKMNNPFIVFPDDLVWDADLTPEGAAAKWEIGNDVLSLLINGEGLYIQDRDAAKNMTGLAGQTAVKVKFMPEIALTLGGAYYGYQNVEGYDVVDWEKKNNSYGNSTIPGTIGGGVTNKAWACEFTPIMGFVEIDLWVGSYPLTFYGQALSNPKADDNNQGFMAGSALGKAKNPKTWEVGYSYAKLEKDATLGLFTDSDRWGGGTDGQGHKFYGKYQLMKNLQAGVTFFLDEKKISDSAKTADYNRLQVDLVASF